MKEEIIEGYRIDRLGQIWSYSQWALHQHARYINYKSHPALSKELLMEEFSKLKEVEIKIKTQNND